MTARDDYPNIASFGVPGSTDAAEAAAAMDELDYLRARCAALESAVADLVTGEPS